MLDTDQQDLPKEIMALVIQGADPPTIREKALQAKRKLSEEYVVLWQTAWLIDNIVGVYAKDPSWQWGLVVPDQSGQAAQPATGTTRPAFTSDRAIKVLRIAATLVQQGASTVTAKDIAQRLRAEGEELPEKDLATAAGNILARANGWRRVRPGVYEPVSVQQELETVG